MSDYLNVLESAIADVGYWRWWADALPDLFMVEFSAVQMYVAPAAPDKPPRNLIALKFREPSLVAFLTTREASVEPDWPQALHEDRLDPPAVAHDFFTLTSEETLEAIAKDCRVEYRVGTDLYARSADDTVLLAFQAGDVGLVVRAKEMRVATLDASLTPEEVIQASNMWWQYWREYWQRKNSDSPMPEDYACEVTIPIAQ